jgi:hypothetical protein
MKFLTLTGDAGGTFVDAEVVLSSGKQKVEAVGVAG